MHAAAIQFSCWRCSTTIKKKWDHPIGIYTENPFFFFFVQFDCNQTIPDYTISILSKGPSPIVIAVFCGLIDRSICILWSLFSKTNKGPGNLNGYNRIDFSWISFFGQSIDFSNLNKLCNQFCGKNEDVLLKWVLSQSSGLLIMNLIRLEHDFFFWIH